MAKYRSKPGKTAKAPKLNEYNADDFARNAAKAKQQTGLDVVLARDIDDSDRRYLEEIWPMREYRPAPRRVKS